MPSGTATPAHWRWMGVSGIWSRGVQDGAVGRVLVFDATSGPRFAERSRRYDWRLLRDSFVHRYDDAEQLRRANRTLAELGYLVHEVDGSGWRSVGELHDGLAAALSLPDHYGRNLDALLDVLRDVAEYRYGSDPTRTGTVLAIAGYDRVIDMDRRVAHAALDVFALAARYGALLGHPMLCLVACTAELGSVGATTVSRAVPPGGR